MVGLFGMRNSLVSVIGRSFAGEALRHIYAKIFIVATLALLSPPQVAFSQTWHDGFVENRQQAISEVEQLADGIQGYYLPPRRMALADAFLEALGGPPSDGVHLADGGVIISGCRLHSCDEKAAILLSPAHHVTAVAMIHYRCRNELGAIVGRPTFDQSCEPKAQSTLLMGGSVNALGADAMNEWVIARLKEARGGGR